MPASKEIWYGPTVPASKPLPATRIRFRTERADEIAEARGLTNGSAKAAFFGVTHHNYSRVVNGRVKPGEDFIAAVLASHPDDPDITFDALFEVVSP